MVLQSPEQDEIVEKLIEIINIDLKSDPYILEGYFLTREIYKKHKAYLDRKIGALNFKLFEYCLRRYSAADKDIRDLYKEDVFE